ncbi:PREDICTED: phosphatidylinositol phosphatase PTPRQ-like isoform X2 [Acropora digitifera]|uniref:phosphatidylinositol phosphatase PTPRQ-like isoform X2 n=1 Tax=Acropora digitifera TaxID=70779 RepID=UPI00077A1753|nr:PREDICTED: phosphatidylinositol phosphatase PTPRQ-like isoform X2 [Acropora digitifera]
MAFFICQFTSLRTLLILLFYISSQETGAQASTQGPGKPRNVTVEATSSTSINVSWTEPFLPNGVISEYWIYFGEQKDDLNHTWVAGSVRSQELSALRPFTTYYIKVRAKTTELGDASVLLNATTFEDSPSAPTKFSGNVFGRHANVSWNEPVNKNGIVRKYVIKVYMTKTGEVARSLQINATEKREAMITELMPFTNYTFTIRAFTVKAGEWANFTARTKEEAPGEPRGVTAKLQSDGSILVEWKDPEDLNGIIKSYQIYFKGKREYDPKFQKSNKKEILSKFRSFEVMERDLDPGTEYTVYMKASTSSGEGNRSDSIIINTPAQAPLPPAQPEVVNGKITMHSIQLKIKPASDSNGKVIFHEVIVEKPGRLSKRESTSLPDEIHGFHEAERNGDRFYVAANLSRKSFNASKEFVLGDGQTYGGYENAKLEPGTKYKAYIRGVTEANGKLLYGKPVVVNLPRTLDE